MPENMERHDRKVSIIGVGRVGAACAYAILQQNIAKEICLVDVCAEKLQGEQMDLQHGLAFTKPCKITASTDFAITANSAVCIVTAGAHMRQDGDIDEMCKHNVEIFKNIIPQLAKYAPETVILVISRPVELLSYVAWKLSGFPKERVVGLGTNVDSARFKFLIADRLQLAPTSCHGWIIGEQGEASIPIWSSVNVAGVPLKSIASGNFADDEHWEYELHNMVIETAKEINRLKGYISWAVGLSTATIVNNILRNAYNTYALSVNVNGYHGIENDVFLSLPCIVGSEGAVKIIRQKLSDREESYFKKSALRLLEKQKYLEL